MSTLSPAALYQLSVGDRPLVRGSRGDQDVDTARQLRGELDTYLTR